jgi:hypothetical protein
VPRRRPACGGAHFAAGWTLSPHLTVGARTLVARDRGELVGLDGTIVPREQRYSGPLAHVALTAARALGGGLLGELCFEIGYAPFGRWRDTGPAPVTGQPWTGGLTITFGVD